MREGLHSGDLEERVRFVHAPDGHRLALTEVSLDPRPILDERPCFLLIHGFAQDRRSFLRGDIPRALLERGARVVLGELRGHGKSDQGEARDWSLATHLRFDLPALIDGASAIVSGRRVHLIGHSMGGMLGYALLAGSAPLLSLTTFAAPVLIGRDRPLIRLAALAASPAVRLGRPGSVPMDRFLRLLAPVLASADRGVALSIARRLTGLANAHAATPETLRHLLSTATPESPRVFIELAEMALLGQASIDQIDLARSVLGSRLPIAAIWGRWDVFTSRASLAPLEARTALGPRLVLEVADALHVDLMVGRHARGLVDALWPFLTAAR